MKSSHCKLAVVLFSVVLLSISLSSAIFAVKGFYFGTGKVLYYGNHYTLMVTPVESFFPIPRGKDSYILVDVLSSENEGKVLCSLKIKISERSEFLSIDRDDSISITDDGIVVVSNQSVYNIFINKINDDGVSLSFEKWEKGSE